MSVEGATIPVSAALEGAATGIGHLPRIEGVHGGGTFPYGARVVVSERHCRCIGTRVELICD